jgi:outer membrane lipoprotein carrier protein
MAPLLLKFMLAAVTSLLITPSDTRDLVRLLESRYKQGHTFVAEFYEQYTDGHGGGTAESGTVYLSHPDRMRWDYQSPRQKLFLVDGTNVWYYVPEDHVASRARMKQSTDWRTPIAFLAGRMNLERFCGSIQLVNPDSDPSNAPLDPADSVLRCVPRSSSSGEQDLIQEVLLEIQPEGFLSRLRILQPGDLAIEFRFGKWQENVAIPESEFHFIPPSGVSIVDEQSLLDSVH